MEIDIRVQYRYANQVGPRLRSYYQTVIVTLLQYPKAIRLVSAGLVNLKPLLTHTFKLEEALDAFKVAADMSAGAIKVQIHD